MRIALMASAIACFAAPLAAQSAPAAASPAKSATPPVVTPGYGAWFGSRPDMGTEGDGVRFAGVTEGSPAAKAGLMEGDILIKLGGKDIPGLQAMTDVLRSKKAGDTVVAVVRRESVEKEFKVVLGARPGN